MIRSVSSTLGMLFRVILTLVIIAGFILVAFVAYKGSQPMQLADADGMTYWQFVRKRIAVISELPAKCQQLHFTGFAIAVPLYPALYTVVGLYPESYIARHTQPDPSIPKDIDGSEAQDTWCSLIHNQTFYNPSFGQSS